MDLTPYIRWIVFLHVLGAFLFVAGHGVSMFVAFRLRSESDRGRMAALLDFSGVALATAYVGLLLLLIGGIVAGIVLGSWGRAWIWVALVLLIGIAVAMTPLGINYFNRLRLALGIRTRNLKPTDPDPVPASNEAIAEILQARNPELLLLVGGGGFVVILWLMMFKPI
jgi:hypothetical protein